jgi:hypothetical protein
MVAKSLANQPLSDDSEKDTEPCSKLVHPNIGLRQHFCRTPSLYDQPPELVLILILQPMYTSLMGRRYALALSKPRVLQSATFTYLWIHLSVK